MNQYRCTNLLLIAQSASMLAQSAARAGFPAFAIDFFADSDTRRYTEHCIAVNPGVDGFDESKLLAAANKIAPPQGGCALVYGSGIDNRPRLVEQLAQGRQLFGNSPATLRRINTPQTFFLLLDQLGIPYPETRFDPPNRCDGWLIKPGCSEGGKGIGFFTGNNPPIKSPYYQRLVPSDAYSMLFLANGKETRNLGFNTLWTVKHNLNQPFLFAGAINRADLSDRQCASVKNFAAKLTEASGLVGLNSLDFVLEDGTCQVLEINPRPSATMALYDEDFAEGLLVWHMASCHGQFPPPNCQRKGCRAMRIVFSKSSTCIPDGFRWPVECSDIPNPGTRIEPGQPICRLLAQGENRHDAGNLIELLEDEILLKLKSNNIIENDHDQTC